MNMNNTLLHIFCFFLVSSLVKSQDVISKIEPFNRINTVSSEYGLVLNSDTNNFYFTSNKFEYKFDHKYYKIFNYCDGKIKRIQNLPTDYNAGPLCIIPGTKNVIISINNPKINKESSKAEVHLYILYENGKLEMLHFNANHYTCMHPYISADGKYLYFSSNMPGGRGGYDIYRSEIKDNNFLEPINFSSKINTSADETYPIEINEKQLSFTSEREDGKGGKDIYIAEKLNSEDHDYRYVYNIGDKINSAADDLYLTVYYDKNIGFFASNREGGVGLDDIYKVDIKGSFNPFIIFENQVLRDSTGRERAGIKFKVLDSLGNMVSEGFTNENGRYDVRLVASEKNTIQFNDEKNAFSINDTLSMGKNFNQDNYILPPEYRTLLCLVKDKNDANFKNIGIVVTCQSDTIVKGIADHKGFYTTKLIPKSDLIVTFSREGYKDVVLPADFTDTMKIVLERDVYTLFYSTGMANLTDESKKEIARFLSKTSSYRSKFKIKIIGHSDYTGSDAVNIKVSARRAKQCADYIRNITNSKHELILDWKGESEPINGCSDKNPCEIEKRGKNRRVEFNTIDF